MTDKVSGYYRAAPEQHAAASAVRRPINSVKGKQQQNQSGEKTNRVATAKEKDKKRVKYLCGFREYSNSVRISASPIHIGLFFKHTFERETEKRGIGKTTQDFFHTLRSHLRVLYDTRRLYPMSYIGRLVEFPS